MKLRKPILVVLALILLCCGGCSRVTFGYNHGDWLLNHWFNDYTSFNEQQKNEIELEVANYMRWHRQEALPEYTAFLQQLNALATPDTTLTPADIKHARAEISRLYKLTMKPLVRPAAHLLSTLDVKQIAKLRHTLADQNSELRDELLSDNEQEQFSKRAKTYLHNTEALVGSLSHTQEKQIRAMSLNIPFVSRAYIEQREARQAGLLTLLDSHANEEQIAVYLSQWIDTLQMPNSQLLQPPSSAYDSAMDEMIVRIYKLLTTEQKDFLRKKISAYIDDLQKLHAEPVNLGDATPLRSVGGGACDQPHPDVDCIAHSYSAAENRERPHIKIGLQNTKRRAHG